MIIIVKKIKRVIAALLACVILTTSTVQHTQVEVYAIFGIDDVLVGGFTTLIAVTFALNGYNTEQVNSLHDVVDEYFIKHIVTAYGFIKYCMSNPDKVDVSINGYTLDEFKNYCVSIGEDINKFDTKVINFVFGAAEKMSDSTVSAILEIGKFFDGLNDTNSYSSIGVDAINFVWNMLKSTGIEQIVKSDIFADYVDDYGFIEYKTPSEICASSGLSLSEFSASFENDLFYLCGYDTDKEYYFAIPLHPDYAYVYGQTSKGYYRLVSFENPQSLRSYFLQYGKGEMTYTEIMDSGINKFISNARRWKIGGTSIGKDSHISGTGQPTTELIQFSYWANSTSSATLSANFSDCYIMYPVASLDSDWKQNSIDLFYTHDGIIARNECIEYTEVTDLGASTSALAGLKLGNEDLEIDAALLTQILSRLEEETLTSDDIADMVAGKNQDVIDSISSSSANVKSEIEKSNSFLSKIADIVSGIPGTVVDGISSAVSVTGDMVTSVLEDISRSAMEIKNIVADIPVSVVDGLSLAISLLGGDITGIVTGVFDIVSDIGETTADLFDIIYRAVVAALKTCFVPPDDFFDNWKNTFIGMLQEKLSIDEYLDFISSLKEISSARLNDFKVTLFGTECTVLTFSWYYKNIDTINDLIRGFTYLVLVFFNINQAYKMLRGTSLIKMEMQQERG